MKLYVEMGTFAEVAVTARPPLSVCLKYLLRTLKVGMVLLAQHFHNLRIVVVEISGMVLVCLGLIFQYL